MYDIPILAPENEAGQPINTSYGHPAAYVTPINTRIGGANSKYWIEFAQKQCCESKKLYNAYINRNCL